MAHPSTKDPYRSRAKEEGYPARSVYKLKEIQDKYRLIRAGHYIVDLGCHPGSWLKFCSLLVGPQGRILGLDLKQPTITLTPNIRFLQADLFTVEREVFRDWAGKTDVVLSDLAPKTSGIKWLDQQRSLELNQRALEIGAFVLKKGGALVLKLFEGPQTREFFQGLRRLFKEVHIHKPKSSRSESSEIFLIGKGFTGRPREKGYA